MTGFFDFALGVTSQTFVWVVLGTLIYRLGWLPDWLVRESSVFVFRVGLPVVLFFGAVKVDYRLLGHAAYLLAPVLATLLIVVAALIYARLRRYHGETGALFVQGAYRSNAGVMGLALASSAYGEEGVALAALPVAIITILYNVIAVILLATVYSQQQSLRGWLGEILRNPLVFGITIGALYSLSGWSLNFHVERVGAIFTAGMLPIALACIGASLNLRSLRESGWLALEVSVWKLVVAPAVTVAVALALGVHSAELGVLYFLVSAPVAAASYVMVVAAGGNGPMAASLVVLSTLLSVFTITLGLGLLQLWGYV